MIEQRYEVSDANRIAPAKRISWGAVFAGVVVTLVTQLLLSLLGLGIGASTIHPATEQNPMADIGIGAGIWFVVSTLLALFAGGCVAGRLAGMPRKTDSGLHGVLTWGSATLITFFLLTSAVGGLLSGAAGLLGTSLTGQGVAAADALKQGANAQTAQDKQATEQKAREVAGATASAVSKGAIWTFVTFLLAGAAAAAGGMVGGPRELAIARTPQQMAA